MEGTGRRAPIDNAYLVGFGVVVAAQVIGIIAQLGADTPLAESTLVATALVVACMIRIHGFRGTLAFAALIVAIPFGSEFLGLLTGVPYGSYTYVGTPGPYVFGLVPGFILIGWINVAYLSIATTTVGFGRSSLWLAPVDGLVATSWDVIADPIATRAGYWSWSSPGGFYGVPVSNFLGWFLVVTALSLAARWVWAHDFRAPRATSRIAVWLLPAMLLASALQYGIEAVAYGFGFGAAIGLGILLPAVAVAWNRLRRMPQATTAPSPWAPALPVPGAVTAGR
jgi:putative membrane protein